MTHELAIFGLAGLWVTARLLWVFRAIGSKGSIRAGDVSADGARRILGPRGLRPPV